MRLIIDFLSFILLYFFDDLEGAIHTKIVSLSLSLWRFEMRLMRDDIFSGFTHFLYFEISRLCSD